MSFRVKQLEWADIDQALPSVQKLECFRLIVDFAIQEGMPVRELTPGAKPWLFILENVYWRAEDLHVLKNPGQDVTPCDVYHPVMHCLFNRKYGSKLVGQPFSMLLAESIASMAEFYFCLEALRSFGFSGIHEINFMNTLVEWETRRAAVPRQQAEINTARFLNTEMKDPYASYRCAVREMFELFQLLFKAAVAREAGELTDLPKFSERCAKLRYGNLMLRLNLGLNVADTMAFGGKVTTPEDQEVVQEVLASLRRAESFLDFLRAMGLPAATTKEGAEAA